MSPFQSPPVLCAGAAHIDRLGRTYASPVPGASNPGRVACEYGGVARNVAENLARLGCPVTLLSRIGKDENGRCVLAHANDSGIDTSLVTLSADCPTGSYTAIMGSTGELVISVDDTDIYREITPGLIEPQLSRLRQFPYWFLDCNLSAAALDTFLAFAGQTEICVGAVSVAKAPRLIPVLDRIGILFASVFEGLVLAGMDLEDVYDPMMIAGRLRERGSRSGVLIAAGDTIVVWSDDGVCGLPVTQARPREPVGAGGSLAAGTIFGLAKGLSLPAAVQWGVAASSEDRFTADPRLDAFEPRHPASRSSAGE